jgi:hypothetical protein
MARHFLPTNDVRKFVAMNGKTDITSNDKLSTIHDGKYMISVADLEYPTTQRCTDS